MKTFIKPILKSVALLLVVLSMPWFANAQIFNAHDSLDINNVSGRINVLGDNFYNPETGRAGLELPKYSRKYTIGSSALWIGGYENGNLKVAAMTYRQNGTDFFPGPLDTVSGTTDTATMSAWNKVFKITRKEITDFLVSGKISDNIKNWPGNGLRGANTHATTSHHLAPYIDINHDGKYNPADGDYPDMNGDEMIWWVMNDAGPHTETKSSPMGLELQVSAFAFNTPGNDAVNNTIFFDYTIMNRSNNKIDSVYLGMFADFDIGYAFDDYIGCSPKINAFFGYNGELNDPLYGMNPPMQALVFLNQPLSKFVATNNNFDPINGNPETAAQYYNYMSGHWKDGSCIRRVRNGQTVNKCVDFMYSGDPSSSDSLVWNEANDGNPPGDRRGVGSIGPFTFLPKSVFRIGMGSVSVYVNQNMGNTYKALQNSVKTIQTLYDNKYILTGIQSFEYEVNNDLKVYPNPATDLFTVSCEKEIIAIKVINNLGKEVISLIPNMPLNRSLISTAKLANGVYTIIAQTKKGVLTQKIMVAR